MKSLEVDIPARLQKRPLWRGLPVPYFAFIEPDFRPRFDIHDQRKITTCIQEDRCPLCGGRLLRGRWFVGGPLSAFHERGCYADPPMHDECAHYALTVYPYLATPSYRLKADYSGDDKIVMDPHVVAGRPDLFVAIMTVKQTKLKTTGKTYLKPEVPFRKVEFGDSGQRLNDAEGLLRAQEALRAHVDEERSVPAVIENRL